jgi:hypothetical protein
MIFISTVSSQYLFFTAENLSIQLPAYVITIACLAVFLGSGIVPTVVFRPIAEHTVIAFVEGGVVQAAESAVVLVVPLL